ncbi:CgeB family protein [Parafrankia elaeagni]|uniref:CgeB family protein n=1 Tax=Parafrankia elaeagni TaxID=222534 RepID=UPI00037280A9|nr:glycosyltransferase [Parafrankia elaeagni]
MQIGVIGPVYEDSFAENIAMGLEELGACAHRLGPAHHHSRHRLLHHGVNTLFRAIPATLEMFQQRLVHRTVDLRLDAVITVQGSLLPTTVNALRRSGTKVCLWYPDAVSNLPTSVCSLPFDALFFKEPWLVERLSQTLRLPVHHLPQACNPAWHRIPADADRGPCEADGHIVVAGNIYGTRARLLSLLLDHQIPLRIYGAAIPRWITDERIRRAHTGKYIARTDKARIFRRAVGVLNNMHPAEINGVNSRLFEAAGCGAAVLTEHRQEVPNLFRPEHEVLPFQDFEELLGHIKTLLESPETGRALGDAASARAHADHTYRQRLAQLLEILI